MKRLRSATFLLATVAGLHAALVGRAYGHRELWKFSPQWRDAANDPGHRQRRHVKELFSTRAW